MNQFVDKYFSILKDHFEDAIRIAAAHKFRREKYLPKLNKIYGRTIAMSMLESLHTELKDLDWKNQEKLINRKGGINVNYVGSEYLNKRNVASISEFLRKSCLYADSIIVQDNIFQQLLHWKQNQRRYWDFNYIIDYSIEMIRLEHLFSDDTENAICVLAPPNKWIIENNNLDDTHYQLMCKSTTIYANEELNKQFSNIEELREFLCNIKDDNHFFNLIKSKKLYSQDDTPISKKYLEDIHRMKESYDYKDDKSLVYETFLHAQNSGRISDLLINGRLGTTPVTDYKTTWNSIKWLIEHDNSEIFKHLKEKIVTKDVGIINALQQEELNWLGNIPINKIKIMRERGELGDLRHLLSDNIHTIENVSDEEFVEVGKKVKYNIEQAMRKHSAKVQDLNEKYRRRYNIGIGSVIVAGTLGVTSALFPPFAVAAGIAAGLTGSGGSFITVKGYMEKREEINELKRKPVAMLFDAKQKK